jgi:16S rRNA (uracil1498-N3)-methyltransferase
MGHPENNRAGCLSYHSVQIRKVDLFRGEGGEQKKAHRWQEIAVKAVKQSRRARVPRVEAYRSFKEAIKSCEGEGLKILLYEKEGENLKNVLRRYQPKKIYAMVGPEGGLRVRRLTWPIRRDSYLFQLGGGFD